MITAEKIELEFPININGADVKVLHMRRPRVNDTLIADKMAGNDAEKEITMFANLCEISPEDIGKLDLKDYRKIQRIFDSFLK